MTAADLDSLLSNAVLPHLDIFGALGLFLGFASGIMPRRSLILVAAAACSVCFALHFAHLGAYTGAAMCSISVMQSLVAALAIGERARPAWIVLLFAGSSLLAAGLTLATWNGWPSACAGIGALLATLARLQAHPQAMRRLFFAASSCWAVHNWLVGSVFGLTGDCLTLSALAFALLRGARPRTAVPATA
ncbi:YgjV family protein [Methylobacterium sp. Leaf456]|uniref:YgjV family protein n=1 Tax=Methylobacterium sp. Leaf456 TaxID=1736382 RepID=UPI000A436DD9|nr:YgjV family protein [Methylobacterium sp. Leaf456]